MRVNIFSGYFRFLLSPLAFLASALLFQSCVDHDSFLHPPLPGNECAPNFQYGYTNKVSYFPFEKITAFLQSTENIDLCRLTIYDIQGNASFSVASPLTVQNIATDNPSSKGFGFQPTIEFDLPPGIKSGIYLIENKIPFIVKTDEFVDLLIVYPSNTANAYSDSGGKSLYTTPVSERPAIVSFQRPIPLQNLSTFCLRWFNTLDQVSIGYIADRDMDDYAEISHAKILIIPGHNEYWTRAARNNFDQFVSSGKHAILLSGNTMWWQVRYTPTGEGLICYQDEAKDPETNPLLKTITWDKSLLDYPIISSIGADFNRGGYGMRTDNGWNGYKVVSPDSPLLKNTGLTKGSIISCPSQEYDGAPIHSFDSDGLPIVDNEVLNFEKIELIAYDKGFRIQETTGTFLVFQRTKTSGIIVNTGSTDWCGENGMGGLSSEKIKTITGNAIRGLLENENLFSN